MHGVLVGDGVRVGVSVGVGVSVAGGPTLIAPPRMPVTGIGSASGSRSTTFEIPMTLTPCVMACTSRMAAIPAPSGPGGDSSRVVQEIAATPGLGWLEVQSATRPVLVRNGPAVRVWNERMPGSNDTSNRIAPRLVTPCTAMGIAAGEP
jgi:hypothetical protein